jgi:putative membrane protein
MNASFLAAAVIFWVSILAERGANQWRSLVALLVTAKFFCLLGAILIFAPRALYACDTSFLCSSTPDDALADQQLAGLLMIAACPLTYVLAGIIVAARWLAELATPTPQADSASALPQGR